MIENNDREYILKKLEYEVLEVSDAFIDIKTLSTISSQSTLSIRYSTYTWPKDPRLISLAQEVSRKIKDLHADTDGSFLRDKVLISVKNCFARCKTRPFYAKY